MDPVRQLGVAPCYPQQRLKGRRYDPSGFRPRAYRKVFGFAACLSRQRKLTRLCLGALPPCSLCILCLHEEAMLDWKCLLGLLFPDIGAIRCAPAIPTVISQAFLSKCYLSGTACPDFSFLDPLGWADFSISFAPACQ